MIDVFGEKEKFIQFRYDKKALWEKAKKDNLFVNPVLKTVFVDEKPKGLTLLKSNNSALSTFTNLNPSNQEHCAIEKADFYALQKSNELLNANTAAPPKAPALLYCICVLLPAAAVAGRPVNWLPLPKM